MMININTTFHKLVAEVIYDKMYVIERAVKTKHGEGKRGILFVLSMNFLFERELNHHLKQIIFHETFKIRQGKREVV